MRPAKVYLNRQQAIALAESSIEEGWGVISDPFSAFNTFAEYYEGYGYHRRDTCRREFVIDKDIYKMYLQEGVIDADLRKPIMDLPSALRYVHAKGLPSNYTLRELRKDLKERGWLYKKGKANQAIWLITRSYLNKFIGEWYGYR